MPSFDIVSKVDQHELTNAVDQANREVNTRFDFKGTGAKFSLEEKVVSLTAPSDFQIQQMQDILTTKLAKRSIDHKSLEWGEIETSLSEARQDANICQGIDKEKAKKLTKLIKGTKLKVQAQICGDEVRVSGKKRDDLQEAIAFFKDQNLEIPLQFVNFRD